MALTKITVNQLGADSVTTAKIADDVEIKDADLVDGMLTIHLEQIIPDYKKPREIPIGGKARKVIKG